MACFLVSAAEAVVVKAVEKKVEKKEEAAEASSEREVRIPWSRKLKWLSHMLWGGVILLAFEHVWHGEVVPYFPFLERCRLPVLLPEREPPAAVHLPSGRGL